MKAPGSFETSGSPSSATRRHISQVCVTQCSFVEAHRATRESSSAVLIFCTAVAVNCCCAYMNLIEMFDVRSTKGDSLSFVVAWLYVISMLSVSM